jgi:BolA family transcriptional regulator, general stress-responsive regulator
MMPPDRREYIDQRLRAAFAPTSLRVIDESHKHVGHAGARDGRGHFAVEIVSEAFRGMTPLARHRAIYAELEWMMQNEIHALSIKADVPN